METIKIDESNKDEFGRLPHIVCEDGFTMSMQCGPYHYSTPRARAEEYSHVEIGFPSCEEELLMPYVEDPDNPTGTVYAYVPVENVIAVIKKHGGLTKAQLTDNNILEIPEVTN